jgi:hypothetical protein
MEKVVVAIRSTNLLCGSTTICIVYVFTLAAVRTKGWGWHGMVGSRHHTEKLSTICTMLSIVPLTLCSGHAVVEVLNQA